MASGGERHNVRLSKALSKLLRHDLDKEGFTPTKEGYGKNIWIQRQYLAVNHR